MIRPTFVVVALGVLASGMGWLTVGTASAETKAERTRAACELVAEALFCEVYGKDAQRNDFLESALDKMPGYVPALWHTGHVRHNKQWVKFDELPKLSAEDARLTAYERGRGQYPKTLQGRLALAEWCAKRKLIDQQRAHLTEVLAIDPDHQQARQLLGFRLVDGSWLSAEEIAEAGIRARQVAARLEEWGPRLAQIRQGINSRGQQKREKARERLRDIHDPAVVPAIELVFCADDEDAALLGVQTLDQIAGHEASVALARQAVFSPWGKVREAATAKLKPRDKQDYVPPLLAALQSPVQSRAGLYAEPNGRLTYRHILYREAEDHRDLAVLDTRYLPVTLTGPQRSGVEAVSVRAATGEITGLNRAPRKDENGPTITLADRKRLDYRAMVQRHAAAKAQALTVAVARQNAMFQRVNQEISRVLSVATGAVVPQTPESWWEWWNRYNEVFVPDDKPLRTGYRRADWCMPAAVSHAITAKVVSVRYSCLAAGTPVWTESGPAAIEQIQVGDRVLSQNVKTGELAYKPVLKTTVRPPAQLMSFLAGGKPIVCTGGHPFWSCGDVGSWPGTSYPAAGLTA